MCDANDNVTLSLSKGEPLYVPSQRQRVELNRKLNIDALLEKVLTQLYDDRGLDNDTRKQLTRSYFEPLSQAVSEGYGKQLHQVEYNSPNFEFLRALQSNTAVFAAFKNHSAIKEMTALLKDETGNLRSREDFKREALKINADYQGYKLDAEYDTAVRQARMAANWQKYEAKKKLYPNLRYKQTRAANPDEKHLKFVGIVRPVEDPFWNTHYPPNRWRCQCSVEQTDDPATDLPDGLPPVDPAFRFNSGKTQQVFDLESSEYIKSVPPKDQPRLIKEARSLVNEEVAAAIDYQPMYSSKSGGTVTAHPLAFNTEDFSESLSAARRLANTGETVKLLPLVKDASLRKKLMPEGVKGAKNPDYQIDGEAADLKVVSVATKSALFDAVERCYTQCNNLVLSAENFDSQLLRRFLKGKLNAGYSKMNKVWIEHGGKWHKLTRERILAGEWF